MIDFSFEIICGVSLGFEIITEEPTTYLVVDFFIFRVVVEFTDDMAAA